MKGMRAVPRDCSDCGSSHIGQVPCGMTWIQRMKSTRLDTGWMPNAPRKNYYDRQSVDEMFGGTTEAERKEELMDDTEGLGVVSSRDVEKANALIEQAPEVDDVI